MKKQINILKESPFIKSFKDFIDKTWLEVGDISTSDNIDKFRNIIVSHPEKGKEYIKQYYEKNKGFINQYCTEQFKKDLLGLIDSSTIKESFEFVPRNIDKREEEYKKKKELLLQDIKRKVFVGKEVKNIDDEFFKVVKEPFIQEFTTDNEHFYYIVCLGKSLIDKDLTYLVYQNDFWNDISCTGNIPLGLSEEEFQEEFYITKMLRKLDKTLEFENKLNQKSNNLKEEFEFEPRNIDSRKKDRIKNRRLKNEKILEEENDSFEKYKILLEQKHFPYSISIGKLKNNCTNEQLKHIENNIVFLKLEKQFRKVFTSNISYLYDYTEYINLNSNNTILYYQYYERSRSLEVLYFKNRKDYLEIKAKLTNSSMNENFNTKICKNPEEIKPGEEIFIDGEYKIVRNLTNNKIILQSQRNGLSNVSFDYVRSNGILMKESKLQKENYLYRPDETHKYKVKLTANVYGVNTDNAIYFTDEDTAKNYEFMNKNKCQYIGKVSLNEAEEKEDLESLKKQLVSKLESFDWYYTMSDNNQVFNDGMKNEKELEDLVKKVDQLSGKKEGTKLYNEKTPFNKKEDEEETERSFDVEQAKKIFGNYINSSVIQKPSKSSIMGKEIASFLSKLNDSQIDDFNDWLDSKGSELAYDEENEKYVITPRKVLKEEVTTADMSVYSQGIGSKNIERLKDFDPYKDASNLTSKTIIEFANPDSYLIKESELIKEHSENKLKVIVEDSFKEKKVVLLNKEDFKKFIKENCDIDQKAFDYNDYIKSRSEGFKVILLKEYLKNKKIK